MPKIRVHISRVLEDGSEVTLVSMTDEPWYVSPVLKDMAKRIHLPMPPVHFKGQTELFPKAA